MNGSIIEALMDNEARVNRSALIGAHWAAFVCLVIIVLDWLGAWALDKRLMWVYLLGFVVPAGLTGVYFRWRKFRGRELKVIMVCLATALPVCMAIPTLIGFFVMPLPIVVAGRYFSRRLVWQTFFMLLAVSLVTVALHAHYALPIVGLHESNLPILRGFLAGEFSRFEYWRNLMLWCWPSFVLVLVFFAVTMSLMCRDELAMLTHQAETDARLADVEKGLAIAATQMVMAGGAENAFPGLTDEEKRKHQPDVKGWSKAAISSCIARCKARAAEDPEFAELVERDPAAAVRKLQEEAASAAT